MASLVAIARIATLWPAGTRWVARTLSPTGAPGSRVARAMTTLSSGCRRMTGGGAMTMFLGFGGFIQSIGDCRQRPLRFSLNPMGGASLGSSDLSGSRREPMTEKAMAPFQTTPNTIPEEMVTRVGSAAGLVARIQQEYSMQVEAEPAEHVRE